MDDAFFSFPRSALGNRFLLGALLPVPVPSHQPSADMRLSLPLEPGSESGTVCWVRGLSEYGLFVVDLSEGGMRGEFAEYCFSQSYLVGRGRF